MEQQNNSAQTLNTVQTFYYQVKKMQELYSLYRYHILQVQLASKNQSEIKITADDKQAIPQYSKQIKQLAINTYVTITALNDKFKHPVNLEKLKETFNEAIEKEFLVILQPCEQYITTLNVFIAQNIIKDNLIDSQDIFNELTARSD